jgi:hypothetical protein
MGLGHDNESISGFVLHFGGKVAAVHSDYFVHPGLLVRLTMCQDSFVDIFHTRPQSDKANP